jgi:peptidoglycan hydrolase-like protein with peptidoglycan-binding domain
MQPAPANNVALAEPATWAAALGNRLKYLQANLAEETGENRQVYLEEELRRALQTVPASKRGLYLDALAERFPTWELATVAVGNPAAVTQPTTDEIVKAFLQLAPQLSGEQRENVKQKLAALGLVIATNKPIEGEALADVQTKLKLGPDDPIDPQRLGKLFAAFAEVMLTLDQLAWNVWRSAAPKSPIRRDTSQGDLRMLTRRSLAGDAEASAAQVQKQLEGTRQLVAGLLAGLGPAGRNFARRYQQRYAPDAIREAVRAEGGGGGLFANAEARCWKKYTDLAAEITDATIENDVQEAVVKYAEDLIRGTNR